MAEHGIDYWKKMVWEVANIAPQDKKNVLDWLTTQDKFMEENEEIYRKYRCAKYMIPALACAIKKGKESEIKAFIKARKLPLLPETVSDLELKVKHRVATHKRLKAAGIKLHSTKITKMINADGTPKDNIADKDKIKITSAQRKALLSNEGRFSEKDVEKMFIVEDRSLVQRAKDKIKSKLPKKDKQ